jgi:hypothetical protein
MPKDYKSKLGLLVLCLLPIGCAQGFSPDGKKSVIVITDLYSPAQDVGDNLDLINAYILPGIELKAVLLDCHNEFRKKIATNAGKGLYRDEDGPRDPGYSAVEQLNYIFKRNVPYGVGPFSPMKCKDDKMEYISAYENKGLDLLKEILEQSTEPVTLVSFGSLRILAVANNRYHDLLKRKVKEIHISAGTSNNHPSFLEWNVALDTIAFVSVMESDLPINIYPCAAGDPKRTDESQFNAFVKDNNNTFYLLSSLSFVNSFPDRLKNYIQYTLSREIKAGYLAILDSAFTADKSIFDRPHRTWETAIWMQVAGLKLIKRSNGEYTILSERPVSSDDTILTENLLTCTLKVKKSGLFTYEFSEKGNCRLYERKDAEKYEDWMNEALPQFYIALTDKMLKD